MPSKIVHGSFRFMHRSFPCSRFFALRAFLLTLLFLMAMLCTAFSYSMYQAPSKSAPEVAYDSSHNRFLAVYKVNIFDGNGSKTEIVGQLRNYDGSLWSPEFTIASLPDTDVSSLAIAVAFDDSNGRFLVIWNDGYPGNLVGQLIDPHGMLNGTSQIISSNGSVNPPVVDLAFDSVNHRFLVVWQDARNEALSGFDIYGQFIEADLSTAFLTDSAENFVITNAYGVQSKPAVAFQGEMQKFLVVWQDDASATPIINGQLINSDGIVDVLAVSESTIFTIADVVSHPLVNPDVAGIDVSGFHFLVAWQDATTVVNSPWSSLVSSSGMVQAPKEINASGGTTAAPRLAYDNLMQEGLAVWQANALTLAQRIDATNGTAITGGLTTIFDYWYGNAPAVAYNSVCNNFLVASEDFTNSPTSIFYRLIGPPCTITVDPSSWSFGTVETGGEATREFFITNNGANTLQITNITLDNTDFSTVGSGCGGGSINLVPGGFCTFVVSFHPAELSFSSATITIGSNDAKTPVLNVNIHGTGTIPLAEALDNQNLTFTTSGTVPWFGLSDPAGSGADIVQSGAITVGETSEIETTVNGPALLSFRWKVTSEPGFNNSLRFLIDGVEQEVISGNVDWRQRIYPIPSGNNHTISWIYTKPMYSVENTGYLDNVQVTNCAGVDMTSASATAVLSPSSIALPFTGNTGSVTLTVNSGASCSTTYQPSPGSELLPLQYDVLGKTLLADYVLMNPDLSALLTVRHTGTGSIDTTFLPPDGYGKTADNGYEGTTILRPVSDPTIFYTLIFENGSYLLQRRNTNTGTVAAGTGNGSISGSGFDGSGRVVVPTNTTDINTRPTRAALQSDGKIVVLGYPNTSGSAVDLFRLNANGTLDLSFNPTAGTGKNQMLFESAAGGALQVIPPGTDNADKIVVALNDMSYVMAMRFNANGTVDATSGFGAGGTGTVFPPIGSFKVKALALDQNGRILLAGEQQGDYVSGGLLCLLENGSPDATFGADANGFVTFMKGNGDTFNDVAVQPDGKILVTGKSDFSGPAGYGGYLSVLRYDPDGQLDPTFAVDGLLLHGGAGNSYDYGQSVVVDEDGRILVGGAERKPETGSMTATMLRLDSDGSMDKSFGLKGLVTFNDFTGWSVGEFNAVSLFPDRKIVAAGYIGSDGTENFILRINGATPVIELSPTLYDFNDVPVGGAAIWTITIANNGDGPLEVSAISISGADYTQDLTDGDSLSNCGSASPTIPVNGSCTVSVKLAPTTIGAKIGTLTVTSNDRLTPTATVSLLGIGTISNSAPVATNGTLGVNEDSPASGTLTASDIDSTNLTYSIVSQGSKGTAIINNTATGTYSYTPNANVTGTDSFTFKVNDGAVDSNVATVSITITPVNDFPTIGGTPATTVSQGSLYSFTPTAQDVDSAPLNFTVVNLPSWALFNAGNGTLSGTPGNDDVGSFSGIVISVSDGIASASLPAFTIIVNDINDPPMISGAPATTVSQGDLYSFTPSGSDVDSEALSFTIINQPAWTSFNTDNGTLRGVPGHSDVGSYSGIVISVSDGSASASLPAFTVIVTDVNVAPVSTAAVITTDEDVVSAPVTPGVSDPDNGDSHSFAIFTQPAHGSASVVGNQLVYTPATHYNGSDSFTFEAIDSGGLTVIGVATVTVTAVNDPPVAAAGTLEVSENSSATGVLVFTDVDSSTIASSLVAQGSKGTATITNPATGAYTYTPNTNAYGSDSFTFKVNDGLLDSNVASVTINIAVHSGDVDGNNNIDIADAVWLIRAVLGEITLDTNQAAHGDVAPLLDGQPSPDGTINLGDVVVLLRHVVGLGSW